MKGYEKYVKELIKRHGFVVHDKFNIAKVNSDRDVYWFTPNYDRLINDWTMVCYNATNLLCYIFSIPNNAFGISDFKKHNLNEFSLNILYNDENFEDEYSGILFKPFLVGILKIKSE